MKYIFEMNVYTDGDFNFLYVPRGMEYDGGFTYSFYKSYSNRDEAIEDVLDICHFLKEHTHAFKDWVKESWCECVDSFIEKLNASDYTKHEDVKEYMYGNYYGTEISFCTKDDYIDCGFYATDEEIKLIVDNHEGITNAMIKEAILNLFRQNTN